VPQGFLWRQADLRDHVQRRLSASLLSVCAQQPRVLVCLDGEIGIRLFGQSLRMEMPVARVAPTKRTVHATTGEVLEDGASAPPHAVWQPLPPEAGSSERKLFEYLSAHGLLLEPFERATIGLREDLRERLGTLVAEGHRALVFTQFTDAVFGARAIAAHLWHFGPLLYTGDMDLAAREAAIREFRMMRAGRCSSCHSARVALV
jgi:hypothetical protein